MEKTYNFQEILPEINILHHGALSTHFDNKFTTRVREEEKTYSLDSFIIDDSKLWPWRAFDLKMFARLILQNMNFSFQGRILKGYSMHIRPFI